MILRRLERQLLLALLSALLLGLAMIGAADAYTCNAGGCTWNSSYTEPSTLTNGQPLTDLTGCTMTYSKAVDGGAPGSGGSFVIAASKPAGGGAILSDHLDATMLPGHTYVVAETVACNSTAFGTGLSSPSSNPLPMNNGVTTNATGAPTLK